MFFTAIAVVTPYYLIIYGDDVDNPEVVLDYTSGAIVGCIGVFFAMFIFLFGRYFVLEETKIYERIELCKQTRKVT